MLAELTDLAELALLAELAERAWLAWLAWLAQLAWFAGLKGGEGRRIWLMDPGGIGLQQVSYLPLKTLSENPIGSSCFGGLVRE